MTHPMSRPASRPRAFAEPVKFLRWLVQSKYQLMARFLGEIALPAHERDAQDLRERYVRALKDAQRIARVRALVTVLLALGVSAAAVSAALNAAGFERSTPVLARTAAYSASGSVALVAARLFLDRLLERLDVTAYFLAVMIAVTPRESPR